MNGSSGLVLFIVFIWVLNFGISYWNARVCGKIWVESKMMGGWTRFMVWMGAIQSALGFTWCYLLALFLGVFFGQHAFIEQGQPLLLDEEALKAGLSLGYLVIVPGLLFSGLFIWIHSLVEAWRRRDLASMGVAGWNTFAQLHNTYSAMRGMPEAWGAVADFFGSASKGGNGKGKGGLLVILLVVLAVIGGILTTWSIINKYAGSVPLPKSSPKLAYGE